MSEAAARVIVTPLQARLAEVYANEKPRTHTEALIKAGYSAKTARSGALDIRERPGVVSSLEKREARKLDKARGLDGIIQRSIEKPELLDDVEPRDRLLIGMQAYKLRHEIGDVQEEGSGDAFRVWRRNHIRSLYSRLRRMETLGIGPLGWRKPTHSQLRDEHNNVTIELTATDNGVSSETES